VVWCVLVVSRQEVLGLGIFGLVFVKRHVAV
jgi:hypothetical protein